MELTLCLPKVCALEVRSDFPLVHVQLLKDVAVDLSELSGSSKSSPLDHACVEYSRNGMLLPPFLKNFLYASKPLTELFQKKRKSENLFVFFGVSPQGLNRVSLQVNQVGQLSSDKLLILEFRNLVPHLEFDLVVQLLGY